MKKGTLQLISGAAMLFGIASTANANSFTCPSGTSCCYCPISAQVQTAQTGGVPNMCISDELDCTEFCQHQFKVSGGVKSGACSAASVTFSKVKVMPPHAGKKIHKHKMHKKNKTRMHKKNKTGTHTGMHKTLNPMQNSGTMLPNSGTTTQ